jgi:hypothetical protein
MDHAKVAMIDRPPCLRNLQIPPFALSPSTLLSANGKFGTR